MNLQPRPIPTSTVPGLRGSARRQARALSGSAMAVLGATGALVVVGALFILDYRLGQAAHRLVKLLIALAGVGAILIQPRIGLFLLPMAVPFLEWMPKFRVLNAANALVLGVFAAWIFSRALAGKPIFRAGRLGTIIGVFVLVTVLGLLRGASYPASPEYSVAFASMELFRGTLPFLIYFMGMSMVRGPKDRHWMAAMVVLAVAAEGAATIVCGPNGRGGVRAVGSFGQPNDLGAYLAMFTCVAAAMLPAVRSWVARAGLVAATALGMVAIFLSLSRGAFLAVGVGLVFVALRSSRVMTVLLLVVLASSPLWVPDSVKQRIQSTQKEVDGADAMTLDRSNQSRLNAWQIVLSEFTNHPLDGVGYAGMASVLSDLQSSQGREEVAGSTHNTFLRMLGEEGIFGLAVFLVFLAACFKLALDGARLAADRLDRQIAVGLGAATIVLAISCAIGDRFFQILITGNFWMLCAIVQDQVLESRARKA